jgi:hypothetical protein
MRSLSRELSLSLGDACVQDYSQSDKLHNFYRWKDADFAGMSTYLSRVDWLKMLTANFMLNAVWAAFCDND